MADNLTLADGRTQSLVSDKATYALDFPALGSDETVLDSRSKQEALKQAKASGRPQPSAAGDGSTTAQSKGGGGGSAGLSRRARIRHVLEIYRNEAFYKAIPLPNQPSARQVRKTPAVSVRRTLGNRPIRQHSQDRMWDLTFMGMVGIATRPYRTVGGRDVSLPGLDILNEFDAFLAHYQECAETDGSIYIRDPKNSSDTYDRTYLVYRDFDLGVGYRVEQQSFEYEQSGMTRVANAAWTLRLQAYAIDDVDTTPTLAEKLTRRMPDLTPPKLKAGLKLRDLMPVDVNVKELTQWRNLATSAGTDLASQQGDLLAFFGKPSSTSLLPQAAIDKINTIKHGISTFNEAVRRLGLRAKEVVDVAKLPVTLLADVVRAGRGIMAQMEALREAGYEFLEQSSNISSGLTALYRYAQYVTRSAEALFGAAHGDPRMINALNLDSTSTYNDTLADSPMSLRNLNATDNPKSANVLVHYCLDGDTWHKIAAHYFGSEDAWTYLASYNGACDVYSTAGGAPLACGIKVLVPGASGSGAVSAVGRPDDLYGTGFAFDFHTGDWIIKDTAGLSASSSASPAEVLQPAQRNGFATVSGQANWRQALIHCVFTKQGELAFAKRFGMFPMEPGDPLTTDMLIDTAANVAAQVRSDPRTANVSSVSLLRDADKIFVEFDAQGVAGGRISMVAPVQ